MGGSLPPRPLAGVTGVAGVPGVAGVAGVTGVVDAASSLSSVSRMSMTGDKSSSNSRLRKDVDKILFKNPFNS